MRVILVDDEPIALDVLTIMLSSYENIDIMGSYTNAIEALEKSKKIRPEVIFLDIEMGEINGLKIAELFMEQLDDVEIVFITAYSQYAVDAFEINAIDYLLKPIQKKRLHKTIERLKEKISGKHTQDEKKDTKKLRVNSFGGFEVLDSMNKPLIWRTQKSKELFAYLWKKRERAVPKMLIMDTIFPDKDLEKASTLLHTTIYQIRKNLKKIGWSNGIIHFNDSYQLNVPVISDIEELDRILESKEYSDENIREVLEIYKGDFLEEGYHWALDVQQIYRDMVFNILEKFTREKLENEIFSLTLKASLDKIYKMDSFNEGVAKMMIHYYGKQSKRASLEAFFNDYVENLWTEMGLEPMESTLRLYKKYMDFI
ncbi:response regulator [Tissierella praeacuta]|uniref:response regulator n=1 Tax=Tissierella praeacuta TaxID=43131 RepID=UPI00333F3A4A